MVTRDDLKHISNLSKIELSEDEFEKYTKQIDDIIKYLDKLDDIKLDEEEAYFSFKRLSDLRQDQAKEFGEDIMKIVKNRKNRFVKGPIIN